MTVSFSSIIGIIIGFITGYFEGALETIFLRIGDVLLAFPGFLLIIIWINVIGNGVFAMIFAITFSSWVGYARLIHGEVLKYKNKDFVLAAKSYNASFFRISFTHLIPHIRPVFFAQIPIDLSNIILIESSLNFLGLGISPKIPTLGHLIFNGQKYMFTKPFLIIFPGIIIFLLILLINLIGEGIKKKNKQDLFNH
jgi:ABC-type dipeptide/oligopeptide/nickel transport system permease subunit